MRGVHLITRQTREELSLIATTLGGMHHVLVGRNHVVRGSNRTPPQPVGLKTQPTNHYPWNARGNEIPMRAEKHQLQE